jgi:hypothetical protein
MSPTILPNSYFYFNSYCQDKEWFVDRSHTPAHKSSLGMKRGHTDNKNYMFDPSFTCFSEFCLLI